MLQRLVRSTVNTAPRPYLIVLDAVIVKLLVVVRVDIATGKHRFDVGQKLRIDSHHVFEVTVDWTILDHPDLAIALDDLRFDLADLLVNQNADVFLAADELLRALRSRSLDKANRWFAASQVSACSSARISTAAYLTTLG